MRRKRTRNDFQSILVRQPFKRPRRITRRPTLRAKHAFKGESKFFETNVDDSVIAANFNIEGSMNLIPQGVTENTRVGRRCTVTQVMLRLTVNLPSTAVAADTTDIIRIILVVDKQCNGSNAAVTQLLENDNYQSFNSLANSGRFRTLWDKTVSISSNGGSGRGSTDTLSYGAVSRALTFFKDVNIPIEFNAGTGAITEVRSNNILLYYGSKAGVAGIDGEVRIRFFDK